MAEPSRPKCIYALDCDGSTALLCITAAPDSQLVSGAVNIALCAEHASLIAATRTQISSTPPSDWGAADRRSLEVLSAVAAMILAQTLNPAEDLHNPPAHWFDGSRPAACR